MAEALLKPRTPQVHPPEPEEGRDGGKGGSVSSPVIKMLGFMLLAFSSAMALGTVSSFLIVSFLVLVMLFHCLFHCLRMYARTPLGSPPRELLKMAAWVLVAMLVITFFLLLELWFLAMEK